MTSKFGSSYWIPLTEKKVSPKRTTMEQAKKTFKSKHPIKSENTNATIVRAKTFVISENINNDELTNSRPKVDIDKPSGNRQSREHQTKTNDRTERTSLNKENVKTNTTEIEIEQNRLPSTEKYRKTKIPSNQIGGRDEKSKLPTIMSTKGHVKNLVQKLNGSLNSGNDDVATARQRLSATGSKSPVTSELLLTDERESRTKLTPTSTKFSRTGKRASETKIPNRKFTNGIIQKNHATPEDQLNIVGVETLYSLLCNKHLALQKMYHEIQKQLMKEQEKRKAAEGKLQDAKSRCEQQFCTKQQSEIRVEKLQQRESELLNKIRELQEQNELLEFRLLELEYINQPNFKSSDKSNTLEEFSERDDISDSGVISLSPCEDFFNECDAQDFKPVQQDEDTTSGKLKSGSSIGGEDDEITSKISKICHSLDNSMDRIILQRAVELIKQYETRITSLETTLTHMCQERIQNEHDQYLINELKYPIDELKCSKSPKVVATVSPFTDRQTAKSSYCSEASTDDSTPSFKKLLFQDVDCLQESGIFDEFIEFDYPERKCQASQTDFTEETDYSEEYVPDLSTELNKLSEIKQRLEERGSQTALLKSLALSEQDDNDEAKRSQSDSRLYTETLKHFAFYKEQYEILCDKIAIYEASEDEKSKRLTSKLCQEVELMQRLKQYKERIDRLQEEKRHLEEEKCEFEEAENDARLRCQKLEVKLYSLMEKKNDLQFQLQQNCRTISNLKSNIDELEKKLADFYYHSDKTDLIINEYEERNFELQEREIETRYRLTVLESAVPAIIAWNLFQMMNTFLAKINYSRWYSSIQYHHSECYPKVILNQDEENVYSAENTSTCSELNLYDNCRTVRTFAHDDESSNDEETIFIANDFETEKKIAASNEIKIKELEIKEKVYEQTLQQADEMITAMEFEYKQKLNELELSLNEKTAKLEQCEKKIMKIAYDRNRENLLIDKLQNAEMEIASLKQNIRLKEEEKLFWIDKENALKEEIENLNVILVRCREIEETLKSKLETERNIIKQQKNELQYKQKEIKEIEDNNNLQMKQLQNQILRLSRDLENYEVTNSELKEEVDTLENAISELRVSLHRAKDEKEKMEIELNQELTNKQKEIEELSRYSQDILASNTAEEISLAHENVEFKTKCTKSDKSHTSVQILQNETCTQNRNDNVNEESTKSKCIDISLKSPKNKVSECSNYPSVSCMFNKPVFKRLMKSELAFNWNNLTPNGTSNVIQAQLKQRD